ncbi:o-succinylbenzoate synthase [Candidatus Roizmanbacteria bacterium RIFCSPHIGHO2_12_FULL_37_23]|nr:MAG: o-succinylbenzoate synthase [Candidatus Roizmanbacteria bacterium RIFCSPHIGHO2_12_FULL_37_23]
MIISKVNIVRFTLNFIRPFVTSFGEIKQRETILVQVFDKQTNEFGWGEAPVLSLPLYNPEIPSTVEAIIREVLFPILKNKTISHPREIRALFRPIKGNTFAKSALETACYDLFGKLNAKPTYILLGGKKKQLLLSDTISLHEEVQDCVSEAQQYIDQGIHYLKLKTKPGKDIEYVKVLRETFPKVHIMVDANSSYVYNHETVEIFKELDKYDLYTIEQPLGSDDIVDHAKLQKELITKIGLDESIESEHDAEKAIELGSCKLVNIKIPRVGGLTEAMAINVLCKKSKISTWVGGMLESPIGFYANVALSTLDNFDLPIDFLGALSYVVGYKDNFNNFPLDIHNGSADVILDKPGLGLDLHWDVVEKNITHSITLS